MPDLRNFGPEFENIIVIFVISVLELVLLKNLEKKKKKNLNLEPKMSYLGIFGLEFENNVVIYEISTFEFV